MEESQTPTIEEAWALSGVDYLIEFDYPDIVDGIRNLALAVLEDILPRCTSSACASQRYGSKDWYCRHCTYRIRIEALGKPDADAFDMYCPHCGHKSLRYSSAVRFWFCRRAVEGCSFGSQESAATCVSGSCAPAAPSPDVHCPRCGRASMILSPELGVRFGTRLCRYMVACGYQEIP